MKSVWSHTRQWALAHRLALSVLLGVLLLYTLVGFLLIPHVGRGELIGYVRDDLHRQLAIGAVSFNPFTLRAEIDQCALNEVDGAPIASFGLLRIRASWSSLIHRGWVFSEVRLEQPDIHALINQNGSLNLARLRPSPAAVSAPKTAASLPALRIATLTVRSGQIHFEDRSRPRPFVATLSPIEFSLTDFRTQPSFDNRYQFSAITTAGERFGWSGEFSLSPLRSSGDFSVVGLRAATIASYLGDALPFALRSGNLDVMGTYQFTSALDNGLSLRLPALRIHELSITPRDAASTAEPWISLPELDVTDATVGLAERQLSIAGVELRAPAVQVWRGADGSLNLQQLLGLPRSAPLGQERAVASNSAKTGQAGPSRASAVTATSNSPPVTWKIAVQQLRITGAKVVAEDRSVSPAVKLSMAPLTLTVQNYSSDGATPISFTLDASLGPTAGLKTHGTVSLATFHASVDAEIHNFDLATLQPYVAQSAAVTIDGGQLSAMGHLMYAGQPELSGPRLELTGETAVSNLAIRDNVMKAKLITWDEARVSGVRYRQSPDALDIQELRLRGAFGRVIIGADGSLNLATALRSARAPARPPSASTAASPVASSSSTVPAALPVRVRRIDIENSAANFTDHSVQPNFSSSILGLSGSVVGLASDPASRAKVKLMGSVDRYAPVLISGEVNLLSAMTYTDLTMDFRNIELATFNPYSGKFAGYDIQQGKLTTEMSYHVENRKLDAKHHIIIDQLEFGAATGSKQAVPLPVKLAVALLKDRNGVINLNLPVGGSLDDPNFHIAPIIWQVLKNLLVKAVTAPFALLGSLFGGGTPDMSYVDFPAGAAMLGSADVTKLNKLASALVERPQLKLDIPLHTSTAGDDAVLARSALERAIVTLPREVPPSTSKPSRNRTAEPPPTEAAMRLEALTAVYRQQFQTDPPFPQPPHPSSNPGNSGTGAGEDQNGALDDAARMAWLEQQLLPKFTPTQAQRDALGRKRAQAAEDAILSNQQVQPGRVFLTERTSANTVTAAARMELKLQ